MARNNVPVPAVDPEVVNNMEYKCMELANDFINTLDDPKEMKTNDGLFVLMIKEIYRKYLIDILQLADRKSVV
mgnify:CR=1 FL=1